MKKSLPRPSRLPDPTDLQTIPFPTRHGRFTPADRRFLDGVVARLQRDLARAPMSKHERGRMRLRMWLYVADITRRAERGEIDFRAWRQRWRETED